ncbi:hypothetical protein ACFQY5_36885 [Paeniroseomonas aquatica]|uniref:hypothetical protein n=1 Tax=Paeniroseomonas aquatica TaxID=373043 RepID=UPI00361D53B5
MAKSETSAPRGTNKVIKAFFEALDSTADAGRSQVARAALAAIREKLTARKDKEKATRQKRRPSQPVVGRRLRPARQLRRRVQQVPVKPYLLLNRYARKG